MYRARKPKRHAFRGMPSCGGAQTQARPVPRDAVSDLQPAEYPELLRYSLLISYGRLIIGFKAGYSARYVSYARL